MDPIDRKQQITEVFDQVAVGYDCEPLRLFPFCAERMLDELRPTAGQKLLDVAAGTGAWTVAAAQRVGPQGQVVAIDLSRSMLDQLEQKLRREGLENVDLQVMDADELEFKADYFDAVNCSFGIFFLEEMVAALTGWARVLRPGGTVMFSSFMPRAFQPMTDLFFDRLVQFGVEPPAEKLIERLALAEQCESLLNEAGLVDVSVKQAQLGYHLRDADEWWSVLNNAALRGWLNRLDDNQREQFRQAHLAEVTELAGEQGIWLDVGVNMARGHRPLR